MCNCVCGHEVRCACVHKGVAVLTTDLAMGGLRCFARCDTFVISCPQGFSSLPTSTHCTYARSQSTHLFVVLTKLH